MAGLQLDKKFVSPKNKHKKMEVYDYITDINTTPFYKIFTDTSGDTPNKIFVNDDWDAICLLDDISMFRDNDSNMSFLYQLFRLDMEDVYLVSCSGFVGPSYDSIKFHWALTLYSLAFIIDEENGQSLRVNYDGNLIYNNTANWGCYHSTSAHFFIFCFSKKLKEQIIKIFKNNSLLLNKKDLLHFLNYYQEDKEAFNATLIANNPWVNRLDEYYELLTK